MTGFRDKVGRAGQGKSFRFVLPFLVLFVQFVYVSTLANASAGPPHRPHAHRPSQTQERTKPLLFLPTLPGSFTLSHPRVVIAARLYVQYSRVPVQFLVMIEQLNDGFLTSVGEGIKDNMWACGCRFLSPRCRDAGELHGERRRSGGEAVKMELGRWNGTKSKR